MPGLYEHGSVAAGLLFLMALDARPVVMASETHLGDPPPAAADFADHPTMLLRPAEVV